MHQILSYSQHGINKVNKPKEKLLHYFNQIRKAAERLMLLINDLLNLSKMESGKMDYQMGPNDMLFILRESISEFMPSSDEKNLSLRMVEPTVFTLVNCDSFKLGQVVRNLLSNAIKFSPEGSQIEFSFKRAELGQRSNTIPSLQVSICDQGVGIPEDEISSIFEKFTQSSKTKTGAGGTGLGLAICYEIIRAHKGKIWAANNPESGTTFSSKLPYL